MANARTRRTEIMNILQTAEKPISAGTLATRFHVSRQVIVTDIALLRASGADILATPRGYAIPPASRGLIRPIVCRHSGDDMKSELYAIVDQGCTVLDVIVEHPIYGQLAGELQLSSRYDVEQFLNRLYESDAHPLSDLTGGVHLHTLSCPDENAWNRVRDALRDLRILLE